MKEFESLIVWKCESVKRGEYVTPLKRWTMANESVKEWKSVKESDSIEVCLTLKVWKCGEYASPLTGWAMVNKFIPRVTPVWAIPVSSQTCFHVTKELWKDCICDFLSIWQSSRVEIPANCDWWWQQYEPEVAKFCNTSLLFKAKQRLTCVWGRKIMKQSSGEDTFTFLKSWEIAWWLDMCGCKKATKVARFTPGRYFSHGGLDIEQECAGMSPMLSIMDSDRGVAIQKCLASNIKSFQECKIAPTLLSSWLGWGYWSVWSSMLSIMDSGRGGNTKMSD